MDLYRRLWKPILFQLDPEKAHNFAMSLLQRGLLRGKRFEHPALRTTAFGKVFPNPLGLAAGFDKNALGLNHWQKLGFGFAEVGTITLRPQPGNDKPRLFRLPADEALINRFGFNNDGVAEVSKRLARSRPAIPIGVNLGKNKTTSEADAKNDYRQAFAALKAYGDYFVINVSSPNTEGLRRLQSQALLRDIIEEMLEETKERPILVKISPDLDTTTLDGVIKLVHDHKLAGIVAANTTTDRKGLKTEIREEGGLSGRPLRNRALQLMRTLYGQCDPGITLIGAGGIASGDDLYDRIASGAHLCQIYTGWVYGGPNMVAESLARLVELLDQHKQTLADLRGSAAR